jgi:hypothetical protein
MTTPKETCPKCNSPLSGRFPSPQYICGTRIFEGNLGQSMLCIRITELEKENERLREALSLVLPMSEKCDPVCLIHGMEMSAHDCLYCVLCFKPLTVKQCAYLPNGKREDVCIECAMDERARIPQAFQEKAEQLTTTQAQLDKAISALEGLAFPMNGDQKWCFCDLAIGNPMFKTHTDACRLASTTLAELKGK